MRFIFVLLLMLTVTSGSMAESNSKPKPAKTKTKVSLAQRKADIQAARRRMGHVGGGFGGARAEGVGKGRTRESAIRHCCYWGRRTPIQIGAAKSANGFWYACVLYR